MIEKMQGGGLMMQKFAMRMQNLSDESAFEVLNRAKRLEEEAILDLYLSAIGEI